MTDEPGDLAGLAAFHAANESPQGGMLNQWLDTGSDTVTHRLALAGCGQHPMPEPLTVAYCLAQAAHWQRLAAEIGGVTLATAAEIETAEYWRARAVEAERELRAMRDLDSQEIV